MKFTIRINTNPENQIIPEWLSEPLGGMVKDLQVLRTTSNGYIAGVRLQCAKLANGEIRQLNERHRLSALMTFADHGRYGERVAILSLATTGTKLPDGQVWTAKVDETDWTIWVNQTRRLARTLVTALDNLRREHGIVWIWSVSGLLILIQQDAARATRQAAEDSALRARNMRAALTIQEIRSIAAGNYGDETVNWDRDAGDQSAPEPQKIAREGGHRVQLLDLDEQPREDPAAWSESAAERLRLLDLDETGGRRR